MSVGRTAKVWGFNLSAASLPFVLLYLAGGWLLAGIGAAVSGIVALGVVSKRVLADG